MLTIQAITTENSLLLEQFKAFPTTLYANDPYWMPSNEAYPETAEQFFLVLETDRIVGRACAMVNPAISYQNNLTGLVGFYECEDNAEASTLLLNAVKQYLTDVGMTYLLGPMNGTTWQKYRLTLPSQNPPFFLDNYHKPWYHGQFVAAGFEPIAHYSSTKIAVANKPYEATEKGLVGWDNEARGTELGRLHPVNNRMLIPLESFRVSGKYRSNKISTPNRPFSVTSYSRLKAFEADTSQAITIRPFNMEAFEADLHVIYTVSIASFQENFLYTPLSFETFLAQYLPVKALMNPQFVLIAEDAYAQPVGFVFAVDNLFDKTQKSLIAKTIAVLPSFRSNGLGTVLLEKIHQTALNAGYTAVFHALMFESNVSSKILADGSELYQTYQLMGMPL